MNGTEDNPVADRLDRSFFGFDQDYYERMPLLVNAMQENHYVDPYLEITVSPKRPRLLRNQSKTTTTDYKTSSIRRTSPRPFIFELRSPTPTPFSRTFGSKSWVESYRNAQRLHNLQQVIQYLEKTINAKFGDLHELPSSSSTHIAFSGVYVNPLADTSKEVKPTPPTLDLLLQSSNKVETRLNHVSDPLFSFKPDSPGDVNLLADGFLRFAPTPTLVRDKSTTVPMFRAISHRKKQDYDDKNVVDSQASENIESATVDKPNSFSVMLNYVPTKTTINTDHSTSDGTSSAINKVYFTTSRPVRVHFKRKSNGPVRRMYTPRSLKKPIINRPKPPAPRDILRKTSSSKETTMVVHLNVYPLKTIVKELDNVTENIQDYSTSTTSATTTETNTGRPLTQAPELTFTQVEDHHVGSSGIIPVDSRPVPPPPPPITVSIPAFETTVSSTTENYSWPTNPPEVVKFSPEDAKVPDYYREMEMANTYSTIAIDSRNFKPNYERFPKQYSQSNEMVTSETPFTMNRRNYRDSFETQEIVEPSTLVVKLKNEIRHKTTTTQETISEEIEEQESHETTTVQTYVPQINGHYRSINQNSRHINDWIDKENDRKRRLEMSVTGLRKPTYVEIRRNNTNVNYKDDDDDDESDV